jgi:spore maturation protein CgeB
MKIHLVSYKNPAYWTVSDYIEATLKEMGHEVLYSSFRDYLLPGRLRDRFPALQTWDLARVNAAIRRLGDGFKPDLFLAAGGHTLEPETIRAAKSGGAVTVLWTSDYPLNVEKFIALAPHFDHYFLSGTDALEHHRAKGNDRGHFLPFACLPELHRPVELSSADAARFACDVAFAGTPYPERLSLLEAVARIDGVTLGVWGPGWNRLPASSPLKRWVRGGPLDAEDFVKSASACKLAFNHMGNPMAPQMEEMCNSRVFELLGCGACQLVDAKRDVVKLFQSGRELVAFKNEAELLSQVRRLLADAGEREGLKKRAREAALAKHTYRHRISEILDIAGVR